MDVTYYARSENEHGEKETVLHHLSRAAQLCRVFLEPLSYSNLGEILGHFHDFGKYSDLFQQVLAHERLHINHAYPGAAIVYGLYKRNNMAKILTCVIAAYHSILDYGYTSVLE